MLLTSSECCWWGDYVTCVRHRWSSISRNILSSPYFHSALFAGPPYWGSSCTLNVPYILISIELQSLAIEPMLTMGKARLVSGTYVGSVGILASRSCVHSQCSILLYSTWDRDWAVGCPQHPILVFISRKTFKGIWAQWTPHYIYISMIPVTLQYVM
jgi:hypothetical protein